MGALYQSPSLWSKSSPALATLDDCMTLSISIQAYKYGSKNYCHRDHPSVVLSAPDDDESYKLHQTLFTVYIIVMVLVV